MQQMFLNTGAPFLHPVTHRWVSTGEWYAGAGHLPHEEDQIVAALLTNVQGVEVEDGGKASEAKPQVVKQGGGRRGQRAEASEAGDGNRGDEGNKGGDDRVNE